MIFRIHVMHDIDEAVDFMLNMFVFVGISNCLPSLGFNRYEKRSPNILD